MILAMVFPVSKIEVGIPLEFPISIVTAIVSPNALPKAKTKAEKIPEPEMGRITYLITSKRVAPKL